LPAHLSPKTINGARGFLLTAFNRAIAEGRWTGGNPVAATRKRKVVKHAADHLRAEEVPVLLAAVSPGWRPLFATAIFAGLRKGELFALRKRDVALDAGLLTVARSHDHATTKGGRADVIPIHPELRPFLAAAIKTSPSELVFPDANGKQRREDLDMAAVLRRALARAEIVTGWTHKCRRQGCGHREAAPDKAPRRCPKCNMRLWAVPTPRPLRFHDLRHTCATLLLQAGASLAVVQKVMRHSDVRLTADTYGHLEQAHLKDEIAKLHLGVTVPQNETRPDAEEARALAVVGGKVPLDSTRLLPEGQEPRKPGGVAHAKAQHPRGLSVARLERLELPTHGFEGPAGGRPQGTSDSQSIENTRLTRSAESSPSPVFGPVSQNSSTRLLPAAPSPLRVVDGGADHLLTVRAVAERLGVQPCTVYALVERGELAHVRVSNAIRVAPADLAAFVEARKVKR
ncbi:MAG: tyrosine-type recombinase/integrase, partial [Acidobacteriota bacterium]